LREKKLASRIKRKNNNKKIKSMILI
jgi:hypothetical protein